MFVVVVVAGVGVAGAGRAATITSAMRPKPSSCKLGGTLAQWKGKG